MKKISLILAALHLVICSYAQTGKPDLSFGNGGSVTHPLPPGSPTIAFAEFDNTAIQSDGKIVAVGVTTEKGKINFLIARYNPDGSPDNSFNGNGEIIPDYGTGNESAQDVAIQSDGKIVVAGQGYASPGTLSLVVARFNPDGSADNTFNGNGISVTPGNLTGTGGFHYMVLQSDGKIIVSGQNAMRRFNTNGTQDNSFGAGFRAPGVINTISLQPDDKILAAGYGGNTLDNFVLSRYTSNGSVDSTFGQFGFVATDMGGYDQARSIAIQADGKILTAGNTVISTNKNIHFAIARYNTNGSLDNTFSDDGKVVTDFGSAYGAFPYSYAAGIAIQENGKIVVGGSALFARYNIDGSLDNSYPWNAGSFSQYGTLRLIIRNGRLYTSSRKIFSYLLEDGLLSGLYYKYYEGIWNTLPDFNNLTQVKSGNSPNIDINVRTPGRNDNFAFIWRGYINIVTPGAYTFETVSDDGSKLYFNTSYSADSIALVNNDGLHAPTPATGTVNIAAAGVYPITFTFFEKDGGESMQAYWTGPNITRQLIPNTAFIPGTTNPGTGGLNYKYYEGTWNTLPDFSTLTPVKTGNSANVDISVRTPGRDDNFAFVWEGTIKIPTPGNYTFTTISDDGSKLYFNSLYVPSATPTVNNDGLHAPTSVSGNVSIPAAGSYPIAITFFEKDGGQSMQVYWSGPGIPMQLIPDSAFSTSVSPLTNGISYKYYEGSFTTLPDFNTLTPVKTGTSPNVDINLRTPGRNDNFAFLWEGYIKIETPGTYTFETVSDDGSKLYFNTRYSASGTPIVNNDGLHAPVSASGTVSLTNAGIYPIAITFFEKEGGESMQVYWSGPGIPRQLIPNAVFVQGAPASNGLNYKYYEGTWNALPDFSTLTPVKTGTTANLDLGLRTAGRNDNFAFVWEGYLTVPMPGDYTLELVSDDGSKFYLNSFYSPTVAAYINNDGLHAARSATGNIHLSGTLPIAITYFEKDGAETMQFYWTGPGISRQLVPNSAFTLSNPAPSAALGKKTELYAATEFPAAITKLYPNPFAERFTIDFYNTNPADDISVAIYDLDGKQVYSQRTGRLPLGNTSLIVNLTNKQLNDGVYMVTIIKNGVRFKTLKLVKRK